MEGQYNFWPTQDTEIVFCDIVRQEISRFTKMVCKTGFNDGLSSILDFKWEKMMHDASECCPSLLEFVKASFTKKHYHNSATKRIGRKVVSLVPVIGSLLCIISFIRTRHSAILQQLVSIMMWLGGCKRMAVRIVEEIYEKPNTKEVIHVAAEPRVDGGDCCICQLDASGAMVYCNNRNCPKGSWFHLECLGMEEDDVPEGEWFCSEECRMDFELSLSRRKKKTADRLRDSKNEYVKRLIWRGLHYIGWHDAVKENDGPRMIRYWKCDLFEFYEKNHPKYLIFGLRLIAIIAGATSERLRHALIWERTVSVKGGKRKNIPKDLHCEHLNREYKVNSRDAGGQLTTDTINRHGQMLGIGKIINHIFDEKVIYRPFKTRKTGKGDRRKDILRMIQTLKSQNLLKYQGGREFKGFEEFKVISGVRFPKNFKDRPLRHMEKMAKLHDINN